MRERNYGGCSMKLVLLERKFEPKFLAVMITFGALLAGLGCENTKYGTRVHDVTLNSEPPGATAYIFTNDEWLEMGGGYTALARLGSQSNVKEVLENHRVRRNEDLANTSSVTPVLTRLKPYETIFIALCDGHWDFVVFKPERVDVRPTINLNSDSPVAPTTRRSNAH
jgi:hypothetical protein